MLESVGNIVDRMSWKRLASQPLQSDQDRSDYQVEFKDLQTQL